MSPKPPTPETPLLRKFFDKIHFVAILQELTAPDQTLINMETSNLVPSTQNNSSNFKHSPAIQVYDGYNNFSFVKKSDNRNINPDNFPARLHLMLSNPEFQEIITWLPHGRSWRVLKRKIFEKEVIPLYFRHSSFHSFMRQVKAWGFLCVKSGDETNSFYHEVRLFYNVCTLYTLLFQMKQNLINFQTCLDNSDIKCFLRGLPYLCAHLRRDGKRQLLSHQTHYPIYGPDFYAISRDHPLPG